MTRDMGDKSGKLQEFLDNKQYTKTGVLRYEFIFGEGFISSGGIETTTEVLDNLGLEQGSKVLDIGCGIGGGSSYLASRFSAHVHGVDLSTNVISIASDRYKDRSDLKFEVEDAMELDLPDSSLDLVYSRDTLLHFTVENKVALFQKAYKWLKPGGKVLITDYCCGPRDLWDEEFKLYVDQRGYSLVTVEEYADILKGAGFEVILSKDNTCRWLKCLHDELDRLNERRDEFLKIFSSQDLGDLTEGWTRKIERVNMGVQVWGMFLVQKQ